MQWQFNIGLIGRILAYIIVSNKPNIEWQEIASDIIT